MKARESRLRAPSHLSKASATLWRSLVPRRIEAPEELAVLQSALEARDRAEECRLLLAKDGLVVRGDGSILRVHPAARLLKEAEISFARAWSTLRFNHAAPTPEDLGIETDDDLDGDDFDGDEFAAEPSAEA